MASGRIDLDSTELCLIDSGICSLKDVPLRAHLVTLNLHSNYIKTIENLTRLRQLQHLDLSSNQISRIEGLDGLVSLRTLNLSCNLIVSVTGLSLRSLVKVNLSYNQIEDLRGLQSLSGPEYRLSHLECHGNKIRSTDNVVQSLRGCHTLRKLVLKQEGSANPVCRLKDYESAILQGLPQLQCLDGRDRSGRPSSISDVLADIPGLEEYMDYLISSGSSSLDTSNTVSSTDHEGSLTPTRQITSHRPGNVQKEDVRVSACEDYDVRLEFLENQLSGLLKKHQQRLVNLEAESTDKTSSSATSQKPVTKHVAKRDVDDTEESGSDSGRRRKPLTRRTKRSKLPSYTKTTVSTRARRDAASPVQTQSPRVAKSKNVVESSQDSLPLGPAAIQVSSLQADGEKRDDIESTYVQLMKQLDEERERRWKAEQAARKLADHIKTIQTKAHEDGQACETAVGATAHLKTLLMNEREAKIRLLEENESLKERLDDLQIQLSRSRESEGSLKQTLKILEETIGKHERDDLQQQAHEHKKLQEAQMKYAAMTREAEMLRHSVTSLKGQLQQLQELLAAREQQHREDLGKWVSLGSREMQEAVQRETHLLEKQHTQEMTSLQQKIDQLTEQYSELENEFRMALQIEANRFTEVQDAFQSMSDEFLHNKLTLEETLKKNENSSTIISELTALVKEQKGRITELSKAKREQSSEYRERVASLEAHVDEARKRMVQFELLKKEKSKLSAHVQALESVIEGLKAERKLWGQELAHQGASLAQDRGRLESKIESSQFEISTLKKQLEKETDAVRIKSKMIDDQTETIRNLKEGLLERDGEVKKARNEGLKIHRDLEEQLAEERTARQDAEEMVERLRERKDELKQQVADLKSDLEESIKAHEILNSRWKEKSSLIGQLEYQVTQMKETWEEKEQKLSRERDKAIEAANLAIEKLRSMDDAFRKQLDAKEKAFQEKITQLQDEKRHQVEEANQRVAIVEDEMRELLHENEMTKKTMEEKLKHMSCTLADLQSNLI
ncbi:leucine-rich repeat and coiled-coil domain-containing protein 1-like isoform X2 [Gigantopelta aegis]|uniref:leucine-rich repeat and coiled-coil domain-containing protein 1-like isoform X2 n=1 Tax=Gigantopelta aegis TaxID=1735272 RepID=UPI001B887ED0|nr:leucine-rich repeat and coiled-coil domain-containing protein 1-like isoform X2 [Gigantopelta aegis]